MLKRKLDPPSEPTIPAFYGLPKIHKPKPIPLRPIVSCVGSVTYNLAKFAAGILRPLIGQSPHYVRNTIEFVDKIKNIRLFDSEILTFYDVTALFTSNPADSAVDVIRQKLTDDPTLPDRTNLSIDQIVEITELCLTTTYFSYKGLFYKQISGCAMGSPLSPIVAKLYMEAFETSVLEEYGGIKPKLWLHFVDDTFVILDKRAGEDFFKFINNKDPNIKFTQEACIDNKIAFLDCLVSIQENGSLKTEVYRKPTHTDHYLRFDSNHPLIHKLGVIRTLFHHGDTIISDPNLIPKERNHIKQSLRKCGYPGTGSRDIGI